MSWTDERVETLKRMWAEGQSASQIAKELGGVTRNAVIGKVHRLGLSNRAGDGASMADEAEAAPVAAAPWFALPQFSYPTWNTEAILFIIPVAIAPTIEHVGNIAAIGSITGRDYMKKPGLQSMTGFWCRRLRAAPCSA